MTGREQFVNSALRYLVKTIVRDLCRMTSSRQAQVFPTSLIKRVRAGLPEHHLRRLLSWILRASGRASKFEVVYIHRGAENDQITINASEIIGVAKGSFALADGETSIPFHRILTIKDLDKSTILWEKRHPHSPTSNRDHPS